jgi:hypothetical protein
VLFAAALPRTTAEILNSAFFASVRASGPVESQRLARFPAFVLPKAAEVGAIRALAVGPLLECRSAKRHLKVEKMPQTRL